MRCRAFQQQDDGASHESISPGRGHRGRTQRSYSRQELPGGGPARHGFEQNDTVGGNWVFNSRTGHASVYENTHIISSKAWSEYEDFPMPDDYPEYPNHRQLQAYFESYAHYFGVMETIRFETRVDKVTRNEDGSWHLRYTQSDGSGSEDDFTPI